MVAAAALTTVIVALNGRELVGDYVRLSGDDSVAAIDRLIAASAAAVNYVAIVASAILMLIVAPQVDPAKRKWHVTGAGVGLAGAFVGLVAYWLFERTWETPMLFLISNVTLVTVLAFAVLSGFKPK